MDSKNITCKLLLLFALMATSHYLLSQEKRYVTEKYNIPKEQCVVYVHELEDYLKTRGLYEGQKLQFTGSGTIDRVRKKLTLGGVDFTKDHVFIVELLGDKMNDEPYAWQEGFGIIEVGFETESKAKEVYEKAREARKKYTMNIPLYCPPFRCIHVGKSVLFVYSINTNMDKYRNMADEEWKPKARKNNK